MIEIHARAERPAQLTSSSDHTHADDLARSPISPHRRRIIVLSSSLLTERMLLHSGFVPAVRSRADLRIWSLASHPHSSRDAGDHADIIEPFPEIGPFREIPHNYLRRLNDFAWDAKLKTPSRLSMMRHVRSKGMGRSLLMLRGPAGAIASLGLEGCLERGVERMLLAYNRSPEAVARLRAERPAVLLTTGPHRFEEPAVVSAAKRLGIPTLALITSWDNISTKNRMPFRHDGYVVWSDQMKRELHDFYPSSRTCPVYVVGAPQFDAFFQPRLRETREQFCGRLGLSVDKPIILYALGSPNFLKEHYGALAFAERLMNGQLGDVQLLVRPHPLFDNGEEARALRRYGPPVHVQQTGRAGLPTAVRSQTEADVVDWVNTFRHAAVVVNLSSTATVDAALFDCPVVNLDYDPEPGQPNAALVHDVNHTWTHFRPIAESGGVSMAASLDATVEAVRAYLERPELHREGRRWIAQHVCGFVDGRCGQRLADALLAFADRHSIQGAADGSR